MIEDDSRLSHSDQSSFATYASKEETKQVK